jgi:hypothetical protein
MKQTQDLIYYAPVHAGLALARHALQGAVPTLLSRAHGSPAVGRGPFDPNLVTACWHLNICTTPHSPALAAQAAAQLNRVRAIVGEPACTVNGFALFELTSGVRSGLIRLSGGPGHA